MPPYPRLVAVANRLVPSTSWQVFGGYEHCEVPERTGFERSLSQYAIPFSRPLCAQTGDRLCLIARNQKRARLAKQRRLVHSSPTLEICAETARTGSAQWRAAGWPTRSRDRNRSL